MGVTRKPVEKQNATYNKDETEACFPMGVTSQPVEKQPPTDNKDETSILVCTVQYIRWKK